MFKVLITGAGKIGSLIACLLADSGDYEVHVSDLNLKGVDILRLIKVLPEIKTTVLNVEQELSVQKYLQDHKITAVISCLPFFLNAHVARAAQAAKAHYFDLTEDTSVAQTVKTLAQEAQIAFVPQCGLAPGMISIIANSLMCEFDDCHHVKLRVGALPQQASNALHYSLTWSTEGLINEYGNSCHAIVAGNAVTLEPLQDCELIEIDGCEYEAFNTSGGLGSLASLCLGKVQTMNYKTIRYPGHCDKMHFLMQELRLNEDRSTLKRILEKAIPKTQQDLVILYVSVEGMKQGELIEKSYVKKIYPVLLRGLEWSAIQISTAAGVCAVADLLLHQKKPQQGLVLQETFEFAAVLGNRFGAYFA